MNTVCLFVFIGSYIGLVGAWGGRFWEIFLGQIVGVYFGILSGALVAMSMSCLLPRKEVVSQESALVRTVYFKGEIGFFLYGTDNIGRGPTYRFTLLDDAIGYSREVPANSRVHIIEDPSLMHIGYWRTIVHEPDRESFLYNWALFKHGFDGLKVQEFRVPVGTVVRNFGKKCLPSPRVNN